MKKILAFAGSNSSKSINKQLLQWVTEQIKNADVKLVSLTDYDLTMYGQDLEQEVGSPQLAVDLRQVFNEHDGFIIASPEHNSMMPAVLKNTFDWLSRTKINEDDSIFNDKPVLLLSTSPGGRGGATNLQNMANVLPYWGAKIKGEYSLPNFYKEFLNGQPNDEHQIKLNQLVDNFVKELD